MQQLAGARVEYGHVPLVWRGVANVAARHRDDMPVKNADRRCDLLSFRQQGDRCAPDQSPVRQGQLLDVSVGGTRVHVLTVRIRSRRRVGDAFRAGPAVKARRRVFPKHAAPVGIQRDRLAVRRGDDEDIVRGVVDADAG